MVLGANGPIGAAIQSLLESTDRPYIMVSRAPSGQNSHAADREDPAAVLDLIHAYKVNSVIDVIAYTEHASVALLKAVETEIDRYVMLSSADVYRNYGLLNRKERGVAQSILTEESPLRLSRFPYRGDTARMPDDPDFWMDDYDKIPIENAVKDMRCSWSILRLPMVYGSHGKLNRLSWMMTPMQNQSATFEIDTATLNWVTTYAFIDNVAAAIIHATAHSGAANQVFNITDSQPSPHRDWINALAEISGWRGRLVETPARVVSPHNPLDWTVPLAIDGTRFYQRTGFQPPVARIDCLRRVWLEARQDANV
ncbi:MAG: hypothetical protein AAFR51_08030 [Pseudomonadota bacterium]